MMDNLTGGELRAKVQAIIDDMKYGNIDIKKAILQAKPFIQEINRRGELIAKEYKKKFYPVKFTTIAR